MGGEAELLRGALRRKRMSGPGGRRNNTQITGRPAHQGTRIHPTNDTDAASAARLQYLGPEGGEDCVLIHLLSDKQTQVTQMSHVSYQ